jgi:hypothetical protein
MATGSAAGAETVEQAHEIIGGFVVRCAVMNYRASQMIAHWFCTDDRERYLSYVTQTIGFQKKKDIVAERLTRYHPAAAELRSIMAEADEIMERRDLAVSGLLSGAPGGPFFVKSFSAGRFITEAGARDVLPVAEIPAWSNRAVKVAEELVRLTDRLNRHPIAHP